MRKIKNHFSKVLATFILLLSNLSHLNAQLSMQFNAVNEYVFSSKEALNFTAINSNPKSFEAIFTGTIKKGNGELICEFKTAPVWLQTGANVFTPFTLSMADLNYHDQDILEIETKSGQYPSGNYTICMIGHCATADCNGLGASAAAMETPICISIQTENPTPLILLNPENESEIEETRPPLSWIPPSPVAGSANLNYTLILVEMLEGQNKADALSQNRPLIEMEGLTNPALMYPSDLPELEKGKWYAWQVQAYVGKTPIAKSEQWKFKVKKDSIDLKKVPKELSYIEIKGQSGASVFYAVGQLKLRHVVRLTTGQIQLTIKDKNGKQMELEQPQFTINPGDNRLDMNLMSNPLFKHGQTYTLTGSLLEIGRAHV